MAARLCAASALGILLVGASGQGAADTLRCGSRLVQPGATMAAVLEICGKPSSKEVVTEPVRARTPTGGTRIVGETRREIWRYERGSRRFPAILTFEEGTLKSLEFDTG